MRRIVDDFIAAAKRSPSAEMVAVLRAAHQVLDQPVIHADPLAMQIIGAQGRTWLEANPAAMQMDYVRAIRSVVAIRSRICEDELRRAVARGPTQYVVLGAGLDTFAFRQPEFVRGLTIFELDQASTQAWKLERLQEAAIDVPENVRFVPVDFNAGKLATALAAAGFDRAQPALFAWLGVSYYLPRESIVETLRFIAGQDAASEVVFDIALDESAVPPGSEPLYRQFRSAMSTAAEPWLTWLAPDDWQDMLRDLGFMDVELLDATALAGRFLKGRNDLRPGPFMAIVVARKGRQDGYQA